MVDIVGRGVTSAVTRVVEWWTLWGEPERVHVQNMEQLQAHDHYQNVTEHKSSGHSI